MSDHSIPHFPVLRAGKEYESLDRVELVSHRDGTPVATVSQANAGIIRRDMRKLDRNAESLRAMPIAERIERSREAARIFLEDELPIGEGSTQTPDDFVRQLSSTSGLPHNMVRANMEKNAFVMAELVGVNYWTIVAVAFLPALLFYIGVFTTVHLIAKRTGLGQVDQSELPDWRAALNWRRLAPIAAGIVGLGWGIWNGNSIQLTACYGMIGIMVAYAVATLTGGGTLREVATTLIRAFRDGGKGVVIVGILLVAAQVFVAMVNLTGVGVAVTSQILAVAGDSIWLIAVIMAGVCLIAGMGLPTSAAYVLVAAVFAPVLIQQGLDPVMVHLFVLYYAALSVITPPVCVAVFVSSTIAQAPWLAVARDTLRLGGTAYALPMLFIAYPGLLLQGGAGEIAMAIVSGTVFVVAVAALFAGKRVPILGPFGPLLWIVVALLAILHGWVPSIIAAALLIAGFYYRPAQREAAPAE